MTLLLERAWVRGAAPVPGELTLLTLNCLADSLARDFAHASPATLAWTHRCALLGAEVRRAAPHIACLQEVDEVHAPARSPAEARHATTANVRAPRRKLMAPR